MLSLSSIPDIRDDQRKNQNGLRGHQASHISNKGKKK
jgi:hypothetical protein